VSICEHSCGLLSCLLDSAVNVIGDRRPIAPLIVSRRPAARRPTEDGDRPTVQAMPYPSEDSSPKPVQPAMSSAPSVIYTSHAGPLDFRPRSQYLQRRKKQAAESLTLHTLQKAPRSF